VLGVVSLVLWAKKPDAKYAIAAGTLDLVSAIGVAVLVVMEHSRSIQPSTITAMYLLSTIVGNCVQLRTLLLRGYTPALSRILSVTLAFKVLLLFGEAWPKTKYLKPGPTEYSPEETTSILTRSVFWWLNSLFWKGNKNILSSEDMFPLDQALHSAKLRDQALESWDKSKLLPNFMFPSTKYFSSFFQGQA
jgi:ATP-binding cassette subfamily C (CFTR/MRP) protein 1